MAVAFGESVVTESAAKIEQARALLADAVATPPPSALKAMGAATLAAVAAVTMAGVMILGVGAEIDASQAFVAPR